MNTPQARVQPLTCGYDAYDLQLPQWVTSQKQSKVIQIPMQPIAPNLTNAHQILIRPEPQFLDKYIARCNQCRTTLFQINNIESMLVWNGMKYLVLNAHSLRSSLLTVDSKQKVQMNGPIAHNIYADVNCANCGEDIGLAIKSPHYKCAMLNGKVLVRVEAIRCYAHKDQKFIRMRIEDAFGGQDFQNKTIEDDINNKPKSGLHGGWQNAQGSQHNGSKRIEQIEYPKEGVRQEKLEDELRMGSIIFSQSLGKLDKRIREVEGVCAYFGRVASIMMKKMGVSEPTNLSAS